MELKKIAVDFDGTIVEHEFPKIGRPIPFAIETLLKLQKENYLLILWTVRSGDTLDDAINYCKERGLEFWAVNKNYPEEEFDKYASPKVNADFFIDDRNAGGLPDWGVIYSLIKGDTKPIYDPHFQQNEKKGFFAKLFG